ncbi:sulfite exporter TauE/SafE family protein [Aquisalimonas sp. 2447]|uniref:sulfite exporter TauE/SafE family protein n=1 Tax=Aquisalimonas sp. 2447 TaxID=2740807 RepID=UPI00143270D7|nr:sulfite exporter TauE/SafE family protein [Aquisalimonas sp. 2447]QIT57007.1 sulfite exporter TauE/SafE family protein [Aquisalimonas sp. 2447]
MDIPLSLTEWVLATLVILGGSLIQGAIGFGVALVGAPLLYLIQPALIPGPMLLAGMCLPMMILLRDWRAVHFPDAGWAVVGQVPGALAGIAVLAVIAQDLLGLVFGALVLLGVALSAVGRIGRPRQHHVFMASGLAGLMATTTSIGGPPLALAFQHYHGARLRGTLSAVFVPGGVIIIGTLAAFGRFGVPELLMGLSLLPGVAVGFWLSGRLAAWLDRDWLRPALLGVSAVAAVAAMVTALID